MKNMVSSAEYRLREGVVADLSRWQTNVSPLYESARDFERMRVAQTKRLKRKQGKLYAHNEHALLLIFQAMDAAGKDSAIEHVMSGVNPQGCQVFSFQHPTPKELDHDFLWRTTQCLPERGRIGIFNRSYYEEVLIVRVHPEILAAQNLPRALEGSRSIWKSRYQSINSLERHLSDNGTKIVKFFLHLSKEEQRKRFLDRIDDPTKNWKFDSGDIAERALWPEYMDAYEKCLSATSTEHAPWYIVPADDKRNARLIICSAILDALHGLKLRYPVVSEERRLELQEIRKLLAP